MKDVIKNVLLALALAIATFGGVSLLGSCAQIAGGGALALGVTSCLSQDKQDELNADLEADLQTADADYAAGKTTPEEYKAAVAEAFRAWGDALGQNVVASTVDAVSARLSSVALEATGGAGLISGLSTLALNLWRNRTRARDFEEVTGKTPSKLHPKKK